MKLSDRLRPGVECAPWVYDEVCCLEAERNRLADMNTRYRRLLTLARAEVEFWAPDALNLHKWHTLRDEINDALAADGDSCPG